MIYSGINAKIQAILESLTQIKQIYAYPTSKIDAYPAAIYYPSTMENSFESTADNFKIYGYKLWIVVNAQAIDVNTVFSTVMPNVMEAVLAKFDAEWSFTSIDGHRVWGKVETGSWSVSEEQAGIEITAEIVERI